MDKTKVLLIVEAMLGGIRQHVVDIAMGLDKEKYEVYLAYSDNRADERFFQDLELLKESVQLIRCEHLQRELSLSEDIAAIRELSKIVKTIRPDIVHCHSSKAGIVGRVVAKRYGVKKVFYTPNAYSFQSPDISDKKRKVYIIAERFLSRHMTTTTINVSKGEMELARKYNLDKEDKFELIYNGIASEVLPEKNVIREENGYSSEDVLVGVTARLAEQKDPLTFMRIAKEVITKMPQARFVYIGDGGLEEEMKQWISEEHLEDKIHMLGFRSDASRLVAMFDVYLSTALYEGLPYSMIEAMRAGVPIIATDVVGNNELVENGKNGILFPAKDVQAGVEAVIRQLETKSIKSDEVVRSFEERFSLKTMMNKLERLFGGGKTCLPIEHNCIRFEVVGHGYVATWKEEVAA